MHPRLLAVDEELGTELSPNRTISWVAGLLAVLLAFPCIDLVRSAAEESGSRAALSWGGTVVATSVLVVLPLAVLRFALRHHTWVSRSAITQDLGRRRRVLSLDELKSITLRRGVSRLGMGPYGNRTVVVAGTAGVIRVSTFFARDLGPLLEALDDEARRRPTLRAAIDDQPLFDDMLAVARSR